jgi:hypothetical protein
VRIAMKFSAAVALAVVLGGCPQAGSAAPLDPDKPGKDPFLACQELERLLDVGGDPQQVLAGGFCMGFIMGYGQAGGLKDLTCITPSRLTDFVLVLNAFVRKNPVWQTREMGPALHAALADAFPCPQ